MLREAQIDVYLQGVDEHMAAEKLCAALGGVQRAPRPLLPACAMPHVGEQRFSEPVDAVQGKLCLLFTAGTPLRRRSFPPCVWRWRCWAAPPRRACL